jgi:ubiquitin-activating enzyme E1
MKLCNVLISGLSGAGLELAKCIILGGVKKVSLHDNANITMFDLGTNFYAGVSDIGLNRADVVYS